MWYVKIKQNKTTLKDIENELMGPEGNTVGSCAKWVKRIKGFHCDLPVINKSWGCNLQHAEYNK